MEFNFETIIVVITIILTGLTAGLCFTWTNAVVPGIKELDDMGFLQAFQQMNRVIINPIFIIVFFGPFISNMVIVYLKYQNPNTAFWVFVMAGATFILGVVFVTIFKNVPINEMLDATNLATATIEELQSLRQKFEESWTQWHFLRTLTSLVSFTLLLVGLILSNQSS